MRDPGAYRVFPVIDRIELGDCGTQHVYTIPGLTKRELFAAMAMQGLLGDSLRSGPIAEYASVAVEYADALLAALEQQP